MLDIIIKENEEAMHIHEETMKYILELLNENKKED